jgi:hypothetical protein
MGFLTTITIYNDGLGDIKKNPKQFGEEIVKAIEHNYNEAQSIGVGCFANIAKIQHSRHADQHAVYVHAGNTLTLMAKETFETEKIFNNHPEFFEKLLNEMKYQVKELKKIYGPRLKEYNQKKRKLKYLEKLK